MVAELADRLCAMLAEGVMGLSGEASLEALARAAREEAERIVADHAEAVSEDVRANVRDALDGDAAAEWRALAAVYGAQAAEEAAARFAGGRTAHFAELSMQAAEGVAQIIARDNVAMADHAAREWYRIAGEASAAYAHGLKPLREIMAEAVAEMAGAGISTVDYRSGVSNQPDVAVRRHAVTQAGQAGGRMTLERCEAYGHELVVTSAHYGARPTHAAWQGRPCAIHGPAEVGGEFYPGLAELTGYGTVGGLKGANCRHMISPYFPGVTQLPATEWPEHEAKFGMSSADCYAATQRQRELERRVRKTKREISAMEAQGVGLESPAYVQKRLVLGRQQKALREHCEKSGLVRQPAREKAYGVKRQPRALTGKLWTTRESGISKKRLAMESAKIDLGVIDSPEWKAKFDGLTGNPKADAEIRRKARAALVHRSGTACEDLHLVSISDGETKASATSGKGWLTVTPTKEIVDAVKKHPGELFAVHNHPSNIPPTGSDFSTSEARRYVGGVVALHNGDVYYYRHGRVPFSSTGFDRAVENRKAKGLPEQEAFEETLREYEDRFGIEWRKM